jgi:hypothetical protein
LTNSGTSQDCLICVALLDIICDHPAMYKVGGLLITAITRHPIASAILIRHLFAWTSLSVIV